MPTTTPPDVAPLLWAVGGLWHGRRILRPGRTTAFEIAVIVDGTWMIQTYTYVGRGIPPVSGAQPRIYVDGWINECATAGWWQATDLRRGLADRELRYLYKGDA